MSKTDAATASRARPNAQLRTLALSAASKQFGALMAVEQLSLTLEAGQIHAIIGENGAGKSTALKLLAGHLTPTAGHAEVDGETLTPHTSQQASSHGIGMVHQHFMLVEAFSALENIMLGAERVGRWGVLDEAAARAHAEEVAQRSGLHVALDSLTADLSVGEQQRLEILRVLYRGASALLLDEPTAVLSPLEVHELYGTLRTLAAAGTAVAVVTHRLDEVVRYCDAVTVMRRGRGVAHRLIDSEARRAEGSLIDELTSAIMGGTPPAEATRPARPSQAQPALELDRVKVVNSAGRTALNDLSLTLQPGEIVGVAGIEGNGQQALVASLAGLQPLASGSIQVCGSTLFARRSSVGRRIAEAAAAKLQVIHADRHHSELLVDASIADNLVLGDLDTLNHEQEVAAVKRRMKRFAVQPNEPARLGAELSGGNQQKVVMARALDRPIKVLVLAQPTRGVDVGTARVIQQAIAELAADGTAVLLLSADLNELRALSHRIVVLRKGRIAAEFNSSASDDELGHAMLGTGAA